MSWLGQPGFGVTATIVRAGDGAPDDYGNEVPGSDVAIPVEGCLFAPNTSDDTVGPDGRVIVSPAAVYAPVDADFRKDDRVIVDGREWFVDGEPQLWQSPWTTSTSGVRVYLRRRS